MVYTEEFILDRNAFDGKGNIYPFLILDIFEKAACGHAETIGVGADEMAKKNLFWIISSILYEVTGDVICGEKLVIKTWPLKPKLLFNPREYVIYNSKGETVVKGSANWLTIDRETRKLNMSKDVFPEMEFLTETNFAGKIPRLRNFDGGKKVMEVVPSEKHIDSNGHVNNKHYTTFIFDALSGFKGKIKTFQIEYVAEIMPDDKVFISTVENGNETLVKGESDKLNFSSKIVYTI